MDLWVVLGAVGSVASIIGLLLPAVSRNQRLLHVGYGIAIACMASVAVWYWAQLNRVKQVERAASALIAASQYEYTSAGFVQAALAFLEKNKDLYPDSYARAIKLVEECACQGNSGSGITTLDFALRGLLRGIGTLESGT
jgi:hypothetical protein